MRRNSRKSTNQSGNGPPERAIVYTGPIVTAAAKKAQDTEVVTLFLDEAITSSAGGVIGTSFTSDPTVGAPSGWAAWSARFREYRVLALEVEFCPPFVNAVQENVINAGTFPIYEVEDRAAGTSPTSYAAAASYASLQMHPLNSRWKRRMDMSSTDEAQFSSTAGSPAAPFYILWHADTVGATVSIGRARLAYVIQFKDRVA
jgi:hypothetical protein